MPKKLVLVVDDEKNIRLALSRALESPDIEVMTAINGEEALSALAARRADVVLLDINMPGMDGIEVLRRIADQHPASRVVMITAYGTIDRAVEAMKLGAVDFLEKPVTPEEVRRLVAEIIDRAGLRADAAQSYPTLLGLAKRYINERDFEPALQLIEKAIAADSNKAEAFNLKGALLEVQGNVSAAQKMYRVALQLEPGNRAARSNLDRTIRFEGPRAADRPAT
jgi:DNA-binding NtrC family response regulator